MRSGPGPWQSCEEDMRARSKRKLILSTQMACTNKANPFDPQKRLPVQPECVEPALAAIQGPEDPLTVRAVPQQPWQAGPPDIQFCRTATLRCILLCVPCMQKPDVKV